MPTSTSPLCATPSDRKFIIRGAPMSPLSGFYPMHIVGADAYIGPRGTANSPECSAFRQAVLPGRCGHRPLQSNAQMQEKRPEFQNSGRRRSPWYHLYSRLRGHSQLCNGRTRRGLLCVQPGSSEATGTSALRKLTPAASSLRCCAKFIPLLSLYRYGKLMRYTSSMMGEGLACCGLTRARNLLRDSRISLRACAMASSVRFMESST